jgi:type IV secretion system protein VirB8
MTMGDRFVNPLGFQVVRYRRDAESLAPVTIGPSATEASPVPSLTSVVGTPAPGAAPRP